MNIRIVPRLLILLSCLLAASHAAAALSVTHAWVRATVPGQSVAAAYLRLRSDKPVTVVDVRTSVARHAEVHEMTMQAGVMKMRRIDRLAVPAGQPLDLKPGGYHLMLIDVTHPLKDGERVPLTVVVEGSDGKREEARVEAEVRSAAPEKQPAHDHHH